MSNGKWYFVYTCVDTFGGGLGGKNEDVEVPLTATTEEGALNESKTIWAQKVSEAHTEWERKKRTWAHPPATPFENGPHTPRVIYKIPLK